MCHSPSGAFWVQTPERACWALADTATATERPATSPPDTTFCAKRFITDLREKGDSPALLPFHCDVCDAQCCEYRLQTQLVAGGARSTVGSIHRRSAVPVQERLRMSEARWMDLKAQSGDRESIARG